ncbi:MAG: hypothetical protein Q8K30_04350 [Candidatus Gracilibacteria bacterium]|nr:hypothetical protein [Candidatus Gracilibacteria bacterium]
MTKKNRATKIMAIFALFGIIIGIVGTGIMIILGGGNNSTPNEQTLTPDDYTKIQELIKSQGGTGTLNNTGVTSDSGAINSTGSVQ